MAWTILNEDLFKQLWQALGEPWRLPRDSSLEDESVGSFLSRRLGTSHIGDNIASAVLHGIYAGDINKLSVKSLLPSLWYDEMRFGTLIGGQIYKASKSMQIMPIQDAILNSALDRRLADTKIKKMMEDASVYTFRNGMSTLTQALTSHLSANKNVQIKTGHKINSIKYIAETDRVKVSQATYLLALHFSNGI